MARTSKRAEDTGKAIKDLFRLASMPGGASAQALSDAKRTHDASVTVPEADRVRFLLDAPSIERLFSAVPASSMVPSQLAAAYLDCSVLTLERRLRAQFGMGWRGDLERRTPPDYRPVGRYRWSLILAQPRPAPLGPKAKKAPSLPKLLKLYDVVLQKVRFLEGTDGAILGAFGQADLTVEDLIEAINHRATFQLLTPFEALARPWARAEARAPWAEAVDAWWRDVSVVLAHGQAQTDALALDAVIGDKPRRDRSGSRP